MYQAVLKLRAIKIVSIVSIVLLIILFSYSPQVSLQEIPQLKAEKFKDSKHKNKGEKIKKLTSSMQELKKLGVTSASKSMTQSEKIKSNKMTWNLHNADIKGVVQQIAQFTGKNFVLGDNIRGNITLIAEKPINETKLYNVFLSALEVIGLTVVPQGGVIKIVQQTDLSVKGMNYPLLSQSKQAPGEQLAVEVIEVVNVPAITIAPMLKPLMGSASSQLIAVTGTNYLIAVDTIKALVRLKTLIKRIDVSSANIDIMPLHYAMASEVVNILNQLINTQAPTVYGTSKVAVAADDRSNSILLSGDKGQRIRLRLIIANLDQKTEGQGNIETVYLRYQKAEDVVQVLNNVVQSYYNQMKGKQESNLNSSVQNVRPSDMQGSSANISMNSSTSSSGDFGDLQTLSNTLVEKPRQVEGVVIGNTSITSEPTLNALIISAPPTLMRIIKQIITQLDVRRRQILVEAIIADVDISFAQAMGVQWMVKDRGGRVGFAPKNQAGDGVPSLFEDGQSLKTLSNVKGGFIAGIFSGSIDALLNMLQSNVNNNVLSTPSVVTLDNVKAQIFSGKEVPVITNVVQTPSSQADPKDNLTMNTSSSFERKAVGTTLALIPQITMSNAVQMQIAVGNTALPPEYTSAGTDQAKTGGPIISNQNIKTSVIVNDGDILVLGGLKSQSENRSKDSVPLLSDIPLLGEAFKYKTKTREDRNLMIFIRPVIMDSPEKSLRITQNKYEIMQDEILLNQVKTYHAVQQALKMPRVGDKQRVMLPNPFLLNQAMQKRYEEKARYFEGRHKNAL